MSERVYREALRKLSPEKQNAIAEQMGRDARTLKCAGFRMLHPEWTEEQIRLAVEEMFHKVVVSANPLMVGPPEFVIAGKLESFRDDGATERLDEIRRILSDFEGRIDMAQLQRLIDHEKLTDVWAQVRA